MASRTQCSACSTPYRTPHRAIFDTYTHTVVLKRTVCTVCVILPVARVLLTGNLRPDMFARLPKREQSGSPILARHCHLLVSLCRQLFVVPPLPCFSCCSSYCVMGTAAYSPAGELFREVLQSFHDTAYHGLVAPPPYEASPCRLLPPRSSCWTLACGRVTSTPWFVGCLGAIRS